MTDRSALVTGSSTGIGRACAERLAALGVTVWAGVRRVADAEPLVSVAPDRIRPLVLDVTDAAAIAAAADRIGADGRGLDGLVNNAGIAVGGPIELVALADLRRQLDVNVVGLTAVTQAMLPLLRARRGRVVNVSSTNGRLSIPLLGAYAASKHAVEALSDALRMELAPWDMHVAVVEPGNIATPIWEKGERDYPRVVAGYPPDGRERYAPALGAILPATRRSAARASPPALVARAVTHALTARRPRTRYRVGRDARLEIGLAAMLPDRMRDRVVRRAMRMP